MGSWYTIGLCLGLGLGLSVAITGILGSHVLGIGTAVVVGAALGGAIGLLIAGTPEPSRASSEAFSARFPRLPSSSAPSGAAPRASGSARTWARSACW